MQPCVLPPEHSRQMRRVSPHAGERRPNGSGHWLNVVERTEQAGAHKSAHCLLPLGGVLSASDSCWRTQVGSRLLRIKSLWRSASGVSAMRWAHRDGQGENDRGSTPLGLAATRRRSVPPPGGRTWDALSPRLIREAATPPRRSRSPESRTYQPWPQLAVTTWLTAQVRADILLHQHISDSQGL